MKNITEGKIVAQGMKFAIVASRFNDFISSKLVEGALDALIRAGAREQDIRLFKCPGAFEIPWWPRRSRKRARSTPSSASGP